MSVSARLRVLVLTSLFPSNVDPGYAPFNRLQFAALAKLADVSVIGVVPWRFGRFYADGKSIDVVREEIFDSIRVIHPRYPSLPGVPSLNAILMALAVFRLMSKEIRRVRPDLLLASYAYPDGCAGVMLGAALGLPVVVKCHGSDLNRVPEDASARFQIKRLLKRAHAVVVVSRQLADRARQLGVEDRRLHVVHNGVDRDLFRPMDKKQARHHLSLPEDRELILYLGHLAEHKGVMDLLAAAALLAVLRPTATVILVGSGPLAKRIAELAHSGPSLPSVLLAFPPVPHAEVPRWMAAADIVCLPSWDEGMPNVIREAHACGRPVVATEVGGIPEAVHCPELGRLTPPRNPRHLAEALAAQLASIPATPEAIAALAQVPPWEESARRLHTVLRRGARRGASEPSRSP